MLWCIINDYNIVSVSMENQLIDHEEKNAVDLKMVLRLKGHLRPWLKMWSFPPKILNKL